MEVLAVIIVLLLFLWICDLNGVTLGDLFSEKVYKSQAEIEQEEAESKLPIVEGFERGSIAYGEQIEKLWAYRENNLPCGKYEEEFIADLIEKNHPSCDCISEEEILETQAKAIEEKREKLRWENRFKKSDAATEEREIQDWLDKVYEYCSPDIRDREDRDYVGRDIDEMLSEA